MSVSKSIFTNGIEGSIQAMRVSARADRWRSLMRAFPEFDEMRVLDIGGTLHGWEQAPVKPAALVMLNQERAIADEDDDDAGWATRVEGDACDLDIFADEHFDLVYSNSVIEHVGGHERRVAFAHNVKRLSDHHWIQTPYRYFPIEPHMLAPGFQFLPLGLRARLIRRWPLGNCRLASSEWPETADVDYEGHWLRDLDAHYAQSTAQSIELLSCTELQWLFPGSRILPEKFLGLTKSITAVG